MSASRLPAALNVTRSRVWVGLPRASQQVAWIADGAAFAFCVATSAAQMSAPTPMLVTTRATHTSQLRASMKRQEEPQELPPPALPTRTSARRDVRYEPAVSTTPAVWGGVD